MCTIWQGHLSQKLGICSTLIEIQLHNTNTVSIFIGVCVCYVDGVCCNRSTG